MYIKKIVYMITFRIHAFSIWEQKRGNLEIKKWSVIFFIKTNFRMVFCLFWSSNNPQKHSHWVSRKAVRILKPLMSFFIENVLFFRSCIHIRKFNINGNIQENNILLFFSRTAKGYFYKGLMFTTLGALIRAT